MEVWLDSLFRSAQLSSGKQVGFTQSAIARCPAAYKLGIVAVLEQQNGIGGTAGFNRGLKTC